MLSSRLAYRIAFNVAVWRECLRVLTPGGHLVAFGGTRTYHRMTCAVEDAGFEIRDCLMWLYGTGFPKSNNVGALIDKRKGLLKHRGKRLVNGFQPQRVPLERKPLPAWRIERRYRIWRSNTSDGAPHSSPLTSR